MYRELITPYAARNSYIKISKPAAAVQIAEAEAALGYQFPEELKSLLLELDGDHYLLFSIREIIENTQTTVEGLKECYPDVNMHIFFAGNGCGDYYCYNILPDGTPDMHMIYIWEHETGETRAVASSISEMIIRYYNDEI